MGLHPWQSFVNCRDDRIHYHDPDSEYDRNEQVQTVTKRPVLTDRIVVEAQEQSCREAVTMNVRLWVLHVQGLVKSVELLLCIQHLALDVEPVVLDQFVPLPEYVSNQDIGNDQDENSDCPADDVPEHFVLFVDVLPDYHCRCRWLSDLIQLARLVLEL